jgi:uncharacterized protein
LLLKRLWAGAALGAAGLLAYLFLIEPAWFDWHDETVEISGLPCSLDGLRVIQLSDIHAPACLSPAALRRIVDQCNREQPDLVVITGDLINRKSAEVEPCIELLAGLRARLGVFAIVGGHDYRALDRVTRGLAGVGITLLRNQAVPLGPALDALWLVGLDDNSGSGRPDLRGALKPVPEGAPVLLLMHSPDSIENVARYPVNLVLSGHTHGGQVCLPFYGPVRTMSRFGRKYARGRFQVKDTVLYVCRGLGSHHHMRFLARPEVVRLKLVRGSSPCGSPAGEAAAGEEVAGSAATVKSNGSTDLG